MPEGAMVAGAAPVMRRKTSYAALAVSTALLASCSGSDDVELGTDWKGSQTYVTAIVSGHTVVVGINPVAHHAQALAVVPQKDGDDDVLAPQLGQSADGTWWLSTPRDGDRPDRLFTLNTARQTLDEKDDTERLRELVPGKSLVAAVHGSPGHDQGAATADGKTTSVLVRDAKTWKKVRDVRVPGSVTLAASDPSSDTVCLATGQGSGMKVSVLDLATGRTRQAGQAGGVQVQQLACPAGTPVLAGTPTRNNRGTTVKVTLKNADGATVVSAVGGRVDAVQASKNTVVVAVNIGEDSDLIELDRGSGRELRRVTVKGMDSSSLLRHTRDGWVMISDDTATVVDLDKRTSQTFDLPGTLTSF
ncbi:hypothetical protein [Streptomyces sp. HUAS TT20]|uniref:hypothetical protein n=1 Tax=Streptomyces sp. HUAS TT20 TaxID=3447509 RepID=UPI0021DAE112|nr:hypothetical protein [Streptomyces sp. HUAS 15-9]UXY28979.1 hypothetical protein N8I87_22105 [Streptomyces sp. HUAS 15-9]